MNLTETQTLELLKNVAEIWHKRTGDKFYRKLSNDIKNKLHEKEGKWWLKK